MPVTTRTTIGGSAPDAQQGASSMVSEECPDLAHEDQKISSKPNQDTKDDASEIEKQRALVAELVDTEAKLADAKRELERLSTASKPKRTPAHPRMQPMRQPELEDTNAHDEMPREYQYGMAQQMQLLGTTIASALSKDKDDSARNTLIPTDSAALIACDLTVHERAGFKSKIKLQASLKDSRVRDLMDIKWETRTEFITQRDALGLKGVDAALSATIYACLKGKEEKAIIKLLMLETETDEQLGASGVLLFDWIDTEGSESALGKDEKRKAVFDAKPFFVAGALEQDNKIMGAQLIKEIEVLPSQYTSPKYSKLALVISKIPSNNQNAFWAQKLRGDLDEAMRKGRAEPWTLKELSYDIAAHLETSTPAPSVSVGTSKDKEVSKGAPRPAAARASSTSSGSARTSAPPARTTCARQPTVERASRSTTSARRRPRSRTPRASSSPRPRTPRSSSSARRSMLWDKCHPGGGATANIAVTQTEDDEDAPATAADLPQPHVVSALPIIKRSRFTLLEFYPHPDGGAALPRVSR